MSINTKLMKYHSRFLALEAQKQAVECQGSIFDIIMPVDTGGVYKFYEYPHKKALFAIEFCMWFKLQHLPTTIQESPVLWENTISMN